MDRDGFQETQLTQGDANNNYPDRSPDNRSIALVSDRDGNEEIYVYLANLAAGSDDVMMRRRDGSDPVNVTDDAPADGWPTRTPGGAHIVYASRRGAAFALYTMRPDGSDERRLTGLPEGYADVRPSLSADGRRVVFNRGRGDTIGIHVVEIPADWRPALPVERREP